MKLIPTRFLAGAAILALVASACSSTGASPTPASQATPAPVAVTPAPVATPTPAPKAVTIEWWHITTGEPGKSIFQGIADAYVAAHPNVKINITVLENEAFKTKLQTTMQSGTSPDLFQSWGGGIMQAQADAGMLQDITAAVAPWASTINKGAMSIYALAGKQYGVPWDMGMVGFWYNKALFTKAGITAPPATWDDFLADVSKLKAAGIVPLAIAGKDMWPSMHLWTYLVLRIGGGDAMATMVKSGNWNTDACKAAGAEVVKLNALDPYQAGFKGATYDNEAAAVGNAKAAMELMGQWAPGVEANDSTSKKGIGADLGWFPFPTVAGGKGAATDGVGGGNGIAVGKNAPPEAIDFLKFFSSVYNATKLNASVPATALSPVIGTESAVTDANLQLVLAGRGKATFMQLYLDQATSPAMGTAINEATIALFEGASTPDKVCAAITTAAAAQ
ncbi:MAG TPA: extracellular solute-binding protein [Candidatus Limnocylindrales bacterium]|nr:extracellular solute-binding protein [Candidatus Limnocylindrales bacterium]